MQVKTLIPSSVDLVVRTGGGVRAHVCVPAFPRRTGAVSTPGEADFKVCAVALQPSKPPCTQLGP